MASYQLITRETAEHQNDLSEFQLVSYNVHMIRSRKDNGNPYGPVLMKQAELVVKLGKTDGAKVLYERLKDEADNFFAVQLCNGSLQGVPNTTTLFEMMAYVIDVEEFYSPSTDGKASEQILAKITLLVTQIRFKGAENAAYGMKFG